MEVIIICHDQSYELYEKVLLPALPCKGDILKIRAKEYEVKFKTFNVGKEIATVTVNISIQ